jgi:ABC-type multidrug transport system ATPase subunit
MEPVGEFVIETHNLSKKFKEVQAVNNLNMKVPKGEIFGFLGPNGAGKTTTIKMILGLTHPTSGRVTINGMKSSSGSVGIRRDMGFLPERISFYDNLTPNQTLDFFCGLKGADKSIIPELIEEVGLYDARDRKVGTFSKGMTQLLGVAQAMIGNPSLYILDEPMGGLDPRWVKIVREKIRMLNDQGATIMFSSHILSEVENLCDRVGIIDNGKLVVEDTLAGISHFLHMKPDGKVPRGISEIPGVEDVSARGDVLSVICQAETKMKVLSALEEMGLTVHDFKTIEPSLEDAFVKLISKKGGGE